MQNPITLWCGDIAIHFIKRIRKSMHFFYEVEVENTSCDGQDYNMKKLTSPHGTNVLLIDELHDYGIKEKKLLKRGHIVCGGPRESGIVGFIKNDIATSAPIVEYKGKKIRLNFERRKRRGNVDS